MTEQYKILLGQVVAHAAIVPLLIYGTWEYWISAFCVYSLMTIFGISLMNHRTLAHNTIEIKSTFIKIFSLFIATISLQGSSLAWVSMHREHHAHSDTEKDPHSPKNSGFLKSYFLSMMHTPDVKRYGRNLLRDKLVIFFHKHFWKINLGYSSFLFILLGPIGVLSFHLVPAAIQWHASSVVNGLAHYHKKVPTIIGYRNFETKELSKNIPLFAYLTFGEGWHNNHHAKVNSYTFKHKWFEYDFVAWIIESLSKFKLVKINV